MSWKLFNLKYILLVSFSFKMLMNWLVMIVCVVFLKKKKIKFNCLYIILEINIGFLIVKLYFKRY